jgi:Tfp pilus assembly protein PilW
METIIFLAGLLVTMMLIAGTVLSHYERRREFDRREELKRNRNEYRTNEEFISFP